MTIPKNETMLPRILTLLTDSTWQSALTRRVKKDDVEDRMVWDATDVYDSDEFVTKFARNHSMQNWALSLTVDRRGNLMFGSLELREVCSSGAVLLLLLLLILQLPLPSPSSSRTNSSWMSSLPVVL